MEKEIQKIQKVLLKISLGEKVFFNIVNYEKMGLIFSRKNMGTDSVGNKTIIDHRYFLTSKGKRILNTMV